MEILVSPSATETGIKHFTDNPCLLASIPMLVGGFPHYEEVRRYHPGPRIFYTVAHLTWPLPGLHDEIVITTYLQDIVLQVSGLSADNKHFKRSVVIGYDELDKWLDMKSYFVSAIKYSKTQDSKDLYKRQEWS